MSSLSPAFQPSTLAHHKQFEIPWQEADAVRLRLTAQGIPFTVVWEADRKQAAIEVTEDVDAEVIAAALADLR